MTFTNDSDLNGASPQFTLTCNSTGGPATTVTWTRDSATSMGDEMTVLDNRETAQYSHTLIMTGRLGGNYQCNVSNSKPSEAVANFSVKSKVFFPNQNTFVDYMHVCIGNSFMHNSCRYAACVYEFIGRDRVCGNQA